MTGTFMLSHEKEKAQVQEENRRGGNEHFAFKKSERVIEQQSQASAQSEFQREEKTGNQVKQQDRSHAHDSLKQPDDKRILTGCDQERICVNISCQ